MLDCPISRTHAVNMLDGGNGQSATIPRKIPPARYPEEWWFVYWAL